MDKTSNDNTDHTTSPTSTSTSAMDVQTYGGPFGRFKEAEKVAQAQEDGAVPFSDNSSSSLFTHDCDCGHVHSDVIGSSGIGGNTAAAASSSSGSSKLNKLDKRAIKSDDEVAANEPERHFRPRTTFGDFSNVELQSDNIDDVVAAMAAATSSSSSSKSIHDTQNKSQMYHAHDGVMGSSVTGHAPSNTMSSQQQHYHHQGENKYAGNIDLHHESLLQSEMSAEDEKTRRALEEIQRFLAQNTLHSLQSSRARENAEAQAGYPRLPPGHRGVQTLLDYNKQ